MADSGLRPRMQSAFTVYTMEWAKNGLPACAPGANISTWKGVQCFNGRVFSLELHFSSLYGPVSTSLGNLSQLTFLILDGNALSGAWTSDDVPTFCFWYLLLNAVNPQIKQLLGFMLFCETLVAS